MLSYLSNFSIPIITAVSLFPLVVCVITIPFLVWNYRKYNGLSIIRSLVIFSFVFYMMCAFFLTLLPLPTIEEVLQREPVRFNYHLFNNIQDTLSHAGFSASDPGTWFLAANWKKALTSSMFFQIIANIIMQVPLGFYLRYYFRVSWKKALLIGFLVSLFYEMTQLTGVWGIYPYAFRCPDVDDLMNNTLGCMIGYAAAPILMHFLPTVEAMDEIAARRGEKLEVIRSFTAFSVDWIVCVFITVGLNFIIGHITDGFDVSLFWICEPIQLLLFALYFLIIPGLCKIQTLGNMLVRVKIVSDREGQDRPGVKDLIYRYLVMYFLEPMAVLVSIVLIVNTAYMYVSDAATNLERMLFTVVCAIYFPCVFALLLNSVRKKGGLPHNTWTKTHLELDIKKNKKEKQKRNKKGNKK